MPFNGSGVFQRLYNWVQDRDNGIDILANKMDAEMDGFADALTNVKAHESTTGNPHGLSLGDLGAAPTASPTFTGTLSGATGAFSGTLTGNRVDAESTDAEMNITDTDGVFAGAINSRLNFRSSAAVQGLVGFLTSAGLMSVRNNRGDVNVDASFDGTAGSTIRFRTGNATRMTVTDSEVEISQDVDLNANLDVSGDVALQGTVTQFDMGQTPQDVLASRSAGTVYQNTTGRPIFVIINSHVSATSAGAISIGSTATPTDYAGQPGFSSQDRVCSFIVPPNYYYTLSSIGSPTIVRWVELR